MCAAMSPPAVACITTALLILASGCGCVAALAARAAAPGAVPTSSLPPECDRYSDLLGPLAVRLEAWRAAGGVNASEVKRLRQEIEGGGEGAFVSIRNGQVGVCEVCGWVGLSRVAGCGRGVMRFGFFSSGNKELVRRNACTVDRE